MLYSCEQATNTAEQGKHGAVHPLNEQPAVVLTKSTTIEEQDTLLKLSVGSNETSELEKRTFKNLIKQLRNLEETSIEPTEVVVPLLSLAGQVVAESSAFLFLINQDTLKLYVDYFEGDLIGSKVFYIAGRNLLAVDVLTMETYETESGSQARSLLTHTFYYQKEELLFCTTHHYPDKKAILKEENLQDWTLICQHLQLF